MNKALLDEMIHNIALHALSTRVPLVSVAEARNEAEIVALLR